MARFYASIQGSRGQATRMGTKDSGIKGHIRGWDSGVEVSGYYDQVADVDVFKVYVTGGSNDQIACKLVATIRDGKLKIHAKGK